MHPAIKLWRRFNTEEKKGVGGREKERYRKERMLEIRVEQDEDIS